MQQPDQVDTEKTFLIESSFSAMRGMGKVALAEAASGIIAGLFEGGRTAQTFCLCQGNV